MGPGQLLTHGSGEHVLTQSFSASERPPADDLLVLETHLAGKRVAMTKILSVSLATAATGSDADGLES